MGVYLLPFNDYIHNRISLHGTVDYDTYLCMYVRIASYLWDSVHVCSLWIDVVLNVGLREIWVLWLVSRDVRDLQTLEFVYGRFVVFGLHSYSVMEQ